MEGAEPAQEPDPNEEANARQAEFDALHSLTRLLLGSALEGSAELTRRLALWEAYLREEQENQSSPLDKPEQELLRHALIGLIFDGQDKARRGLSLLWGVQKRLTKTAVRTARPFTHNRFLEPVHLRLDRAAERGQAEIVRWIERGQREEPISRDLARMALEDITAEIIGQLADNQEVQELVQQQSVGLATEVVEQVRERTFTADTLVERIARAVTRRAPRLESAQADLSEYDWGALTPDSK